MLRPTDYRPRNGAKSVSLYSRAISEPVCRAALSPKLVKPTFTISFPAQPAASTIPVT